jgi:hypothetical protein
MNVISPSASITPVTMTNEMTNQRNNGQHSSDGHSHNTFCKDESHATFMSAYSPTSHRDMIHEKSLDVNEVQPSSPSRLSHSNSHRHCPSSTSNGLLQRQLSPPDPMSDRVSTILVWQHLTVQIREDKRQEFFQRMKSYKHFTPKRKCLLNNISGAITGGLWAVMGE